MKIFGISLIKNEADVIIESLSKASAWCDSIFVLDNGSDDDSWEIVLGMAKENEKIVPFAKDASDFHDGLRAQVFNQYRHRASEGDWWCRLDSDEIYIDDPKQFLEQVPKKYKSVYSASFQYYFTEKELSEYNKDADAFLKLPVEIRIRHYLCNWSEIRFFRHSPDLVWCGGHWPANLGIPYKKRIRLKHFQYRSPDQIQTRLNARLKAHLNDPEVFSYDAKHHWREKICFSESFNFDKNNREYHYDDFKLPQFRNDMIYRLRYFLNTQVNRFFTLFRRAILLFLDNGQPSTIPKK
jgi:hypothetical protein